ncbi:Rod binding protein [Sulfitobacter marinus]|uniref:Rod binding protein n=1 Tax=Sulfitobacter marinus TaxID=394264 RepID=A0A1I6V5F9_9RHOB|nr:rod-binding protein [Sulfitobacter marinus]SFT08885.1 Rod binding protein [Sulfitobacter marinus]
MELPPLSAIATSSSADTTAARNRQAPSQSSTDFEAMFLGQMVDEMLSTVNIGDFGGGHAEETWRSFLSDAIGRSIAEQNSTGIAKGIDAAIQRYQTGQDL